MNTAFTIASNFITLFTLITFTVLGSVNHSWIWYVIAGFGWIYFAFSFWSDNTTMAIIAVLAGMACIAGAAFDKGKKN